MTHKIIPVEPFDYFVFGGTGDLAQRKLLPALYHRFADGQIPKTSRIVGCARTDFDDESFREFIAKALSKALSNPEEKAATIKEFLKLLSYQKIDIDQQSDWKSFVSTVKKSHKDRIKVYYLSVGPSLFGPIIDGLKSYGLNEKSRLVVEKPLGFDSDSAQKLNQMLGEAFDESSIYRIDHYLGKETVQNLMALRFANALFEPLWNSRHVDHVQITASETLGLQGRGGYYDKAGAMRDMVQNHLLQLLCLSSMEPPYKYDADSVRDEKLKVLKSLKPLKGHDVLINTRRGQYVGDENTSSYLQDVDKANSTTESYVAIKAEINNWRWSGTPFYLRTGKRLKANMTEITFVFRETPHSIFEELETPIKPNALVIRLQPNEGIDLEIMTKDPGPGGLRLRQSSLDMSIENIDDQDTSFRMPDAYERLLLDVVRGNQTLFMRGDEVEAAWRWVDPIIESWQASGESPEQYDNASQGPDGAMELMAENGRRWRRIQ
ncbi:MAG: glucose-6-phosphate dehydrogenase [Arenicella sp.]